MNRKRLNLNILSVIIYSIICLGTSQYCPQDIPQLDTLVKNGNMTLVSYEYDVEIRPDYRIHNGTEFSLSRLNIESKCVTKLILENTRSNVRSKSHCTIIIDSYQAHYSHFGWKWEQMASGTLHVEKPTAESETKYYRVDGLFPVGSGTLSNTKGKYKISVARPKSENYTVFSSMPRLSTKPSSEMPGWVCDEFLQSIPVYPIQISVAILGGQVVKVEHLDPEINRVISISWSRDPDEVNDTLNMSKCIAERISNILKFYETKLGSQYPLQKLDIIVPGQGIEGTPFQTEFGLVINGNLKNVKSCDISMSILPNIFGQWTLFLKSDSTRYSDTLFWGLVGTLSLWGVAHHQPGREREIFDESLYNVQTFFPEKSGQLVMYFRMLENIVTTLVFEDGIHNFMKNIFQEGVTVEMSNFLDEMQQQIYIHNKTGLLPDGGITVNDIMDSWLNIDRYPVIRVSSFSHDPNILILAQETVFKPGKENSTSNGGFWIPIEIVTESERKLTWLSNNTSYLTVTLNEPLQKLKFLLVNPNITGNFRVLYDTTLIDMISKQLLIRLLLEWIACSRLSNKYIGKEDDTLVLEIFSDYLKYFLEKKNFAQPTYQKIKQYFSQIIDANLSHLGLQIVKDDVNRKKLVNMCIKLKTPFCVGQAKLLMNMWKANPYQNPFDKIVLGKDFECLALGGTAPRDKQGFYDFYTAMLSGNKSSNAEIKECGLPAEMEKALLCTENPTLVIPHLRKVIEETKYIKTYCLYKIIVDQPSLVPSLYLLMKDSFLSGKIQPDLFATFADLIVTHEAEGAAILLLGSLEDLLLQNANANFTFLRGNSANYLRKTVDSLKRKKAAADSLYVHSGLAWLSRKSFI